MYTTYNQHFNIISYFRKISCWYPMDIDMAVKRKKASLNEGKPF